MAECDFDVVVAGLGPWGAAATWSLSKRGLRVGGFDRYHPPHGLGSHSGTTRLARWSTSQSVVYAPITKRAFALWAELQSFTSKTLLDRTGALCFASRDEEMRVPIETLESLGMPYEFLNKEQMTSRFPGVSPVGSERVLYEPNGARIRSAEAIAAFHTAAHQLGAQLHFNCPVIRWRSVHGIIEFETPSGTYTAKHLVLAAGSWNPSLLGIESKVFVERQLLVFFKNKIGGEWPCLFFSQFDPDSFGYGYGALETDGRFKLAHHHGGKIVNHPDDVDRNVRAEEIEPIVNGVRARVPGLDCEVLDTVVCLYTNTPDDHWIIDRHPLFSNVTVGAACCGRGFRYAPAIGEILADSACGLPPHTAEFFFNRSALA